VGRKRSNHGVNLKNLDAARDHAVTFDGIEWMTAVALWVASFPGSLGRMAAFGTGPFLVCTMGSRGRSEGFHA
jgi:hypothetical protein